MYDKNLPLNELKNRIEDCFTPRPWIYWFDLMTSVVVAYTSFYLVEAWEGHFIAKIFLFFLSSFALYRAALFVHELTHQERHDLPLFSYAWNVFVGIPLLIPSFMYRGVHIDHHKRNTYGTENDGEYYPMGAYPIYKTIFYSLQSFLLPMLLVFRFLFLTPLSILHPTLRSYVMRRMSAFAIRFDTNRKIPVGKELLHWYVLEALAFAWVFSLAYLFVHEILNPLTLLHIYAQFSFIFLVNSVRTIVAHRYLNRSGREMTFMEQLEDSVNFEGNSILAGLVAPVGLRYHGLHHLFPTVPYHNLNTVHKRILAYLPPDSLYQKINEPTLWSALETHWKNTQHCQDNHTQEA